MATETDLCVAVTGPTGTLGFGLVPLLQADGRVSRLVGIARRPFDPADHGWTKMEYRQGDVRDPEALEEAFHGADVVVHLAFLVIGGKRATTRAVNIDGTLNAFRAASAAGAHRFVFTSSVAAYGFHPDNPTGMTEDWPVRRANSLSYAQEKAELEDLLQREAAAHPGLALYLVRPPVVLGPHAIGAKKGLGPLAALGRDAQGHLRRLPVRVPAVVPDVPVQFVHEDDLGQALLQCVVGAGPPGAYNIAADDVLSLVDVAHELGLIPIRVPGTSIRAAARLVARLPLLPSSVRWLEVLSHPPIMDTTRAKTQLGWTPRYTALEAVRDTFEKRS